MNYGPTILAFLEYTARMYGVTPVREELRWGTVGGGACEYTQTWGDRVYIVKNDGRQAALNINGKEIAVVPAGTRVVTDLQGNILVKERVEPFGIG